MGVEILKHLELKVTPPNQFNDPFEFTPHIISSNPIRKARAILKSKTHLKDWYVAEIRAGNFRGTFREYRKFVKLNRKVMVVDMARHFPTATAEVQQEMLDKISMTYGVLCLSKRRDSILMWGHYCDKHRGLVIGFDASNAVFNAKNGNVLRPVVYVKERVVFDATWNENDDLKFSQYEQQIILSKNADWSYEEELRLSGVLSPLKRKPLSDGSAGYFLPIPPAAFKTVTLGARFPSGLENEVRATLAQTNLSHVKIDRAELHESKFELRFV